MSAQAKTFAYEDTLPALQVPDLETTIKRYLDSVKASKFDFLWKGGVTTSPVVLR